MRRAQAAIEFMMTYGWAFMVVLVTIGALAYFGVLNPDRFVPDRCTFQQEIQCTDFQASLSGSDLVLRTFLQNNLGKTITIPSQGVNVTSIDAELTVTCTAPSNIGAGGSEEVNCTFTNDGSFVEGAKAKFEAEISYQEVGGRYDHVVFGDVLATIQ